MIELGAVIVGLDAAFESVLIVLIFLLFPSQYVQLEAGV
jgi:hypothetical protein